MERNVNKVRLLNAGEIECRVAAVSENGVSLLLYKDARVDQKILDETFGPFGWKRSHQCIDGNLYCTVEIKDAETGEWIGKQDVGTTGYAEKEKSQASDSFKRACFNWGIGRELYTAPFIWIPASKVQIKKKDGKCYCNENFKVASITYSGSREITGLSITDGRGRSIFEWKTDNKDTGRNEDNQKGSAKKAGISKAQMDGLETELQRTGVAMEAVKERYNITDPKQMSEELYNKVMNALSKTKSSEAA